MRGYAVTYTEDGVLSDPGWPDSDAEPTNIPVPQVLNPGFSQDN